MDEERNSKWSKRVVYSLIVVVVLLIILILFLYLIRSPLIFKSGAASLITTSTTNVETNITPALSLDNSYVFASPLKAKTGGEKIRITVFVLDSRGLGIQGKKVAIGEGKSLQVVPIQPVTDGQGRATFDISCNSSPGVYIITASADGTKLVQEATISFD